MILPIVKYGHPVLRQRGASIDEISPEIEQLIEDMLETMYEAQGVGLAAQQVAQALQLTVIDVLPVEDRPSRMLVDGQPVDLADHMPMVLINPEWSPAGPNETGPEGCLSFPEIYGDVTRPGAVDVRARNRAGEPITFRAEGLLARAIQHEGDHLNGILFIDRMSGPQKAELRPLINRLQSDTKRELAAR